ncbi:hypothetical protein CQA49_06945 [Helicobacter sp. MIT 00-7814]|uniref:major outer membrane protein n=1 Tax=unclassified Helicobacter TaxID=2593540 RepID=UPI000E1E5E13|nr:MULTISPECIES: major outer membrane protein [unclassified Helicobacter]RDU52819.1 hypothetical protein CQA37_08050 [Helicobacter sp. MIT 99-10781]RDU53244.1 hypothetical protein CQA49_06945 [Helicobacter sp. MIT 00-7814]
MNKKISLTLAALLAVGQFTAYAVEEATTEKVAGEKVEKVEKAEKKPNMLEAMSFKGFAFMRYSTADGEGGAAQRQQYRMKLDATTGKVEGFSFTAGIYLNQGSSTPGTNGNNTDKDIAGSQAIAINNDFADRLSIATYYGTKEFGESIKTTINLGRLNIASVFTDKNTDLGTGAEVKIKGKNLSYSLSHFDNWMTNNLAYGMRAHGALTGSGYAGANMGMGNNLTLFNIKGEKLGGFDFGVTLGNAVGLIDYLAFGEVGYKTGGFHILAQVAAAGMNSTPSWGRGVNGSALTNWNTPNNTTRPAYNFGSGADANAWAKNRGIYNVQVGYKIGGFSSKLGYLGSFGDGYGVLLDSKGGINIAGKAWSNNYDSANEGFGFIGNGSRAGTSIMAIYAQLNYAIIKPLKLGLDVSYVGGDNNYNTIAVAKQSANITEGKGITFTEIAPSLSYKLNENFEFSVFYAYVTGDVEFGKSRFELKYNF